MAGFIKIHRKMLEWEWYKDINTHRLFMHLILSANYKDLRFEGQDIKRGQVITGLPSLSEKTNLTIRQLRTALTKLKKTNEITVQTTNKFSVITIVNYNFYQDKDSDKQEFCSQQEKGLSLIHI